MKFEKKKAKTTTYLFKTCKHRDRHRETDTFVTITALSYGKGGLSHWCPVHTHLHQQWKWVVVLKSDPSRRTPRRFCNHHKALCLEFRHCRYNWRSYLLHSQGPQEVRTWAGRSGTLVASHSAAQKRLDFCKTDTCWYTVSYLGIKCASDVGVVRETNDGRYDEPRLGSGIEVISVNRHHSAASVIT